MENREEKEIICPREEDYDNDEAYLQAYDKYAQECLKYHKDDKPDTPIFKIAEPFPEEFESEEEYQKALDPFWEERLAYARKLDAKRRDGN